MNQPEIKEALDKGIRAARRGRKEPAQRLLGQVVQSDPENEEAWLWLSRVIDAPTDRANCLQRVLAINPDNQWAADQLAELQAMDGQAASDTVTAPAISTPSNLEIKTLSCPNCNAPLEIHGDQVKTLVCNSCDSVLDLTAEQAAILNEANPNVRPVVPIGLGAEGEFHNEAHQVIGWIRYQGRDDEDVWDWDEWLMISASGEYRWLSFDREVGFTLLNPIEPTEPFNPRAVSSIPVPGGSAQVIERGVAKIVALKGELTWKATIGNHIGYLDAQRGDVVYSVEYNDDELELFSGRRLSADKVWATFGNEEMAAKARELAELNRTDWRVVFGWMAAICAILSVLAIGAAFAVGSAGSELASADMKLTPRETRDVSLGSFDLDQRTHRIRLKLTEPLSEGESATIVAKLQDSNNIDYDIYTYQFQPDVSDETQDLFRPRSSGQASIRLVYEEGTADAVPLTVTLERGILLSRFFVMYALITIPLTIFFTIAWIWRRSRSTPADDEA